MYYSLPLVRNVSKPLLNFFVVDLVASYKSYKIIVQNLTSMEYTHLW